MFSGRVSTKSSRRHGGADTSPLLKRLHLGIARRLHQANEKRRLRSGQFPSTPPFKQPGIAADARSAATTITRRVPKFTPLLPFFPTDVPRLPHPCLRRSYTSSLNYNRDDVATDKTPKLRFQEKVSVVEIPSYRAYSVPTRQRLYAGHRELKSQALQNTYEMLADGGPKEWRNFREESDFIRRHGESLHPCTLARMLRQESAFLHQNQGQGAVLVSKQAIS